MLKFMLAAQTEPRSATLTALNGEKQLTQIGGCGS
jgi:hypothetical protein